MEKFGYLISYRGPLVFSSFSLSVFPFLFLAALLYFFFISLRAFSSFVLFLRTTSAILFLRLRRHSRHGVRPPILREGQPLFLVKFFIVRRGMTSLREENLSRACFLARGTDTYHSRLSYIPI